jgi:hypothetical protein
MFALLFVVIVFAIASLVTFLAFAAARDGYEDDSGFHRTPANSELKIDQRDSNGSPSTPLPPWAAAG